MENTNLDKHLVEDVHAAIAAVYDANPQINILLDEALAVSVCNSAALDFFGVGDKDKLTTYLKKVVLREHSPTGEERLSRLGDFAKRALACGRADFILRSTGKPEMNAVMKPIIGGGTNAFALYLSTPSDTAETIQTIIDSTPLIISIWDCQGKMIDCNQEALKRFGLANKEEFVNHFYDLNPEYQPNGKTTVEMAEYYIGKTIETGFQKFDWQFLTAKGESLPVETILLRSPWKESLRILAYSTDLRDIKKANAEVKFQNELLLTVNNVAEALITSSGSNFAEVIEEQLKTLSEELGANRGLVWENFEQGGKLYCRQSYKWISTDVTKNPYPEEPLAYEDIPAIYHNVMKGNSINERVAELPDKDRRILESFDVKTIFIIPIKVHDGIWGYLSFDNCLDERLLPTAMQQAVRSCGILIASSILRNRSTNNLIAAKEELLVHSKLLAAVNTVARKLLATDNEDMEQVVYECLRLLGENVEADKVSIWRNFHNEAGVLCTRRFNAWHSGHEYDRQLEALVMDYETYLPQWDSGATGRSDLNLPLGQFSRAVQELYLPFNTKTLLVIPIEIQDHFWGLIVFSHSEIGRLFNDTQSSILRSGGMLIASAITRTEVNKQLVQATADAMASVRAKNEFLARMSHEIRTPLNAVIGMTTVAKSSRDEKKIQDSLDVIASSARQLLGIVNNILDMSDIDLGKIEIIERPFDFEKMLTGVMNRLQPLIEGKKQEFHYEIKMSFDRLVIADEQRIAQILNNLLNNAVKFTDTEGHLALAIEELPRDRDHSTLVMRVKDSGIGIEPDIKERLFKAFEQAEGSLTRRYGGSGLGLSLSKSIIDLMGGSLDLESEVGEGSTFIVSLPITWGGVIDQENQRQLLDHNLRILVVDDSPDVLEYFSTVLKGFSLKCETALDKATALSKFQDAARRGQPYDVIFLDWYLPDGTGGDVVKEMQATGEALPDIVLMSVANWSRIVEKIRELGVGEYLSKPLLPSDIFNKLVALKGNRRPQGDGQYHWEDKTVLLVEDIAINRMIAKELMAKTGVQIECAENGAQAVEMFGHNPQRYDLILMDIQMPVMDGLTATEEIRKLKLPRAKTVPIYAMTAHTYQEDIDKCLAAGMNGHISKPIDIRLLHQAMAESFRMKR